MHGPMSRPSRAFALLSSLAAGAVGAGAQVQPGQVAPLLEVAWVGPPVAIGGAGPPLVVVAFHDSLAAAAADGAELRDLGRRSGVQGRCTCVGLPQRPARPAAWPTPVPPAAQLPAVLAVDTDGHARARWLGEQASGYVVVAEHDRIAWTGRPGQGLRAAVAAVAQ